MILSQIDFCKARTVIGIEYYEILSKKHVFLQVKSKNTEKLLGHSVGGVRRKIDL